MTTFLIAALWGTLLMTQATDNLHVEPGKQLPQSLAVHVGEKDSERDVTIRYLLFTPESYQPTGEKWPLLLFLHGYGESSDDNLDLVKTHGPAKIVSSRPDFPFVVITPQCPPPLRGDAAKPGAVRSQEAFRKIQRAWKPEELIQLVDNAIQHLNVDPNRVYVTGLSMGGYGTWRLACHVPRSLRRGRSHLRRRRTRHNGKHPGPRPYLGISRRERPGRPARRVAEHGRRRQKSRRRHPPHRSTQKHNTTPGQKPTTTKKSTIGSYPTTYPTHPNSRRQTCRRGR